MNHIKLFEELTFDIPNVNYTKSTKDNDVYYHFSMDGYEYEVSFTKTKNVNEYSRSYFINSREDYLKQVNKNPLKIVGLVTKITNSFIMEYSPDIISIQHMNMEGEKVIDKINKRASINYQFLKKYLSKDYKLEYYNVILHKGSSKSDKSMFTLCFMYMNQYDISKKMDILSKNPCDYIKINP